MMSLLKVYEEEDEAFMELVTVATQFHQYLLQPFRDMRELAILYKLEILVGNYYFYQFLSCFYWKSSRALFTENFEPIIVKVIYTCNCISPNAAGAY